MNLEPKKKKTPTPIETRRIIQTCCLGVSPFEKKGRMTSWEIVRDALKIRVSSVESIARKGRTAFIVTERLSWLKRVRHCWKVSLAWPSA